MSSDFDKYYAVGKMFSKVNAHQFKTLCERIGAPIEPASRSIKKLFHNHLIEEVFYTKEYAFDAVKLKERMSGELEKAKIAARSTPKIRSLLSIDCKRKFCVVFRFADATVS